MCGIVAAVADRNIVPVLLEGLRKLEYRGYDSAGLALIDDSGLHRLRAVGRVASPAGWPSSITGSSRTTSRCAAASRTSRMSSLPTPTPRSLRT